jgi:hypothetical protein
MLKAQNYQLILTVSKTKIGKMMPTKDLLSMILTTRTLSNLLTTLIKVTATILHTLTLVIKTLEMTKTAPLPTNPMETTQETSQTLMETILIHFRTRPIKMLTMTRAIEITIMALTDNLITKAETMEIEEANKMETIRETQTTEVVKTKNKINGLLNLSQLLLRKPMLLCEIIFTNDHEYSNFYYVLLLNFYFFKFILYAYKFYYLMYTYHLIIML